MVKHLLMNHVAVVVVEVFAFSTTVTTGNGKAYFRIPASLDGYNLTNVGAQVGNAQSTSGTPTVQVARLRAATAGGARTATDALSPVLTIDINEWDSKDATATSYVNPSAKDMSEGDLLRVDVDVAGTGTQGLLVTFTFG